MGIRKELGNESIFGIRKVFTLIVPTHEVSPNKMYNWRHRDWEVVHMVKKSYAME
jgi:hypothetical protein